MLAGATPAAIGLLADVTEAYPDDRGAIMGLYSVFLGLGQIIGSLVGGIAAEFYGLDGISSPSFLFLAIALVPLAQLRRFEHFVAGPGAAAASAPTDARRRDRGQPLVPVPAGPRGAAARSSRRTTSRRRPG